MERENEDADQGEVSDIEIELEGTVTESGGSQSEGELEQDASVFVPKNQGDFSVRSVDVLDTQSLPPFTGTSRSSQSTLLNYYQHDRVPPLSMGSSSAVPSQPQQPQVSNRSSRQPKAWSSNADKGPCRYRESAPSGPHVPLPTSVSGNRRVSHESVLDRGADFSSRQESDVGRDDDSSNPVHATSTKSRGKGWNEASGRDELDSLSHKKRDLKEEEAFKTIV